MSIILPVGLAALGIIVTILVSIYFHKKGKESFEEIKKELPELLYQMIKQYGLDEDNLLLENLNKAIAKATVFEKRRIIYLSKGIQAMIDYKYAEAIDKFQKCNRLARKDSERCAYYYLIGICQKESGQIWEAKKSFKEMRGIAEKASLKPAIAAALRSLGTIYGVTGKNTKAFGCLNCALEITKEINHHRGQALCFVEIGHLYRVLGKKEKALEFLQKANELAVKIEDNRLYSVVVGCMGRVYLVFDDPRKALDLFEKAQNIYENTNLSIDIGNAYLILGEPQKALECYLKALKTAEKTSNPQGLADALSNIGSVYYTLGELQKALEYHEKALKIHEKIGNLEGRANNLDNIGLVYYSLDEPLRALDYCYKSLEIASKNGYLGSQAQALENIGAVYCISSIGNFHRALEFFNRARDIFVKIGDKGKISHCDDNIARARQKLAEQGN